MTNKATVEYWKEKLDKEKRFAIGSDNRGLLNQNSVYMMEILKYTKKYNENLDRIYSTIHHWWWIYHSAKRVMKKYKVKTDIYASKKATEAWRKLFMGEKYRKNINNIIAPPKIPEIINLLEHLAYKDPENREHYLYVINQLLYKGVKND